MARPNILIVLSDQQRPDAIGAYGQRLPVTPTIDALAGRGTIFDRAFCVNPVCGPSRAAIQTGRRPTEVGCWRNGLALGSDTPTIATRLAAAGYRTGYVGKWHLASDLGPSLPPDRERASYIRSAVPVERRGGWNDIWVAADALELTSGAYSGHVWDERGQQVELSGYRVDAIGAIATERIHMLLDGDNPFVLFVSFLEPHHQNDRFRTIGPRGLARTFRGYDVPGDLRGTLGDWRWNYAASLAACHAIDDAVAGLLAELEAAGVRDDTLVVYSSDHGSHFRTRNLEYKRTCHDASTRVPLIVDGPGFTGAGRDDRLVTHLDLLPTLLHTAGVTDDDDLTGRALQPDAHNTGEPWRDEVFIQISESQIGRALRTDRWTYSAAAPGRHPLRGRLAPAADTYVETHCYDLDADPHQRHDLAGDPTTAPVRARLARRLADAIERHEHTRPRVLVR